MPRRIRELRADLHKAGFTLDRSRGSHTVWKHSLISNVVVLSGGDGEDAKPYQEKDVRKALRQLSEAQER